MLSWTRVVVLVDVGHVVMDTVGCVSGCGSCCHGHLWVVLVDVGHVVMDTVGCVSGCGSCCHGHCGLC